MTTAKEREEGEAAERKAAERKAAEQRAATSATTQQPAATAAGVQQSQSVDEANRVAQEEARQKDEAARKKEAEDVAKMSAAGPGLAGPDASGRADNAANYDRPVLSPQPNTEEFHQAHPGAITSGSYNPREQSAEDYHAMMSTQHEADEKISRQKAKQ